MPPRSNCSTRRSTGWKNCSARPEQRRMRLFRALLLLLTGALLVPPTLAADEFDIFDINEGELRFLERPPEKSPHLHSTHVFISEESLKTGWVTAKQER